MDLSFKIWLKTQGIYLIMLYIAALIVVIISLWKDNTNANDKLEMSLSVYAILIFILPLIIIAVECIFSIPCIFLFALVLETLKKRRSTTQEKTIIAIIGVSFSFYACALFMALFIPNARFLEIIQNQYFNIFTTGVLVASLISVLQNRKMINQFCNPDIESKNINQ